MVFNFITVETIRIQFQPNIKEKILKLLNTFYQEEVQIIFEDSLFEENKNRVYNSYSKQVNEEEKLYDIHKLDVMLEETISKYED